MVFRMLGRANRMPTQRKGIPGASAFFFSRLHGMNNNNSATMMAMKMGKNMLIFPRVRPSVMLSESMLM